MVDLDLFATLPNVWKSATGLHDVVWSQIRRAIDSGRALNESERTVLLVLLKRLDALKTRDDEASRKALKHLGFKPGAPTALRNRRIADLWVEQTKILGKSNAKAEAYVMRREPEATPAVLRKIIQNGKLVGAARVRMFAKHHAAPVEITPPKKR